MSKTRRGRQRFHGAEYNEPRRSDKTGRDTTNPALPKDEAGFEGTPECLTLIQGFLEAK